MSSYKSDKEKYNLDLPSQFLSQDNIPSFFDYSNTGIGFDGPPPPFRYCELGQACAQQCDPSSVVPCTSVDANPCFDPTCSPLCELDGLDTTCYENHEATSSQHNLQGYQCGENTVAYVGQKLARNFVSTQQVPASSFVSTQDLPNINRPTFINSAGHPDNVDSNELAACFHPEHAGTGCINPQLLGRKSTGISSYTFEHPSDCCCEDPAHVPNLQDAAFDVPERRERSTMRRETKKKHRFDARAASSNSRFAHMELSPLNNSLSTPPAGLFTGGASVPSHQQVSMQPGNSPADPFYSGFLAQVQQSGYAQPYGPMFTPPQSSDAQTPSPMHHYQPGFTPETDPFEMLSTAMSVQCRWICKETGTICGKTCSSAANLQGHIEQAHLPQRRRSGSAQRLPILCCWENCEHAVNEKAFRQNQHLKDHIRTHTHHKPYECDWQTDEHGAKCGKGFGEKKALDSHKRTHTKEKPFRCHLCDKTFAHQSTLSSHMPKHDQVVKKYKCLKCDHMDNDRANLSRHWDTHHDPRYTCKYCHKTFSKKANALRHLNNRSCKNLPGDFNDELLKTAIFCQPREKGEIDFSLFETKKVENSDSTQ